MQSRLLRSLAKALAKNGVKFLCGLVPGGAVLFDIASDAWDAYRESCQSDALRAELSELALASGDQVRQEAHAAAEAAAADLPEEVGKKIAAYLSQVPGMIRRSLRRPSDPTGTTVPADLPLRSPEDLLPFLPPNPPRFEAGMRPLPGVDWVLEEPLGGGGFGEVWKARHAHLASKPPVALKFCLDPSAARVLRNEAGVLDRLMRNGRQQGIVPLLDAYLDADPPCLMYEYVEGGDLSGLIRELHAKGRPAPDAANRLLMRLADIIAAPHRADPAIVHDDLKPSNVLVRRGPGREPELHVTDFGIGGVAVARAVQATRQPTNSREQLLTEAVRGAYTPLYASPQQMTRQRGEAPDPRDDVHALGVIWYQLVTGDLTMLRVPADWTDELRGCGLREELIGLLGTCIASKADKRPASAGILAGELRALMIPAAKSAIPPLSPSPLPPPVSKPPQLHTPERRSVWRRPVLWVVLSVLLLGSVVTLVVTRTFPFARDDKAASGEAALDRTVHDFTNTIGMKFKRIEPGSFLMGSPDGTTPSGVPAEKGRKADETPHRVTLTKGFHMGVYPVTRGQFYAFVKDTGYLTEEERADRDITWRNPGYSNYTQADDDPVVWVSWNDAMEFCKWLTKKEGPFYELPTEAQWEYVCRAGTTTAYSFGDDPKDLGDYAWYLDNSEGHTHLVGGRKPNPWGLYDMNGHVMEWCADSYRVYPIGDITDPFNGDGGDRVCRGGSWREFPGSCRAAHRVDAWPASASDFGFRVCVRLQH